MACSRGTGSCRRTSSAWSSRRTAPSSTCSSPATPTRPSPSRSPTRYAHLPAGCASHYSLLASLTLALMHTLTLTLALTHTVTLTLALTHTVPVASQPIDRSEGRFFTNWDATNRRFVLQLFFLENAPAGRS